MSHYTFTDLFEFLRLYAPALELMRMRYEIEHMRRTASKAFYVWHGHHDDTPCRHCDPVGWDEIERDRARRGAK